VITEDDQVPVTGTVRFLSAVMEGLTANGSSRARHASQADGLVAPA
jgi:hypothetical protein